MDTECVCVCVSPYVTLYVLGLTTLAIYYTFRFHLIRPPNDIKVKAVVFGRKTSYI